MLTWKIARRLIIFVIGMTVVLIGAIFLITPGPGIASILLGLAILATEFVWAQQLLHQVKTRTRAAANSLGWSGGAAPPSPSNSAQAAKCGSTAAESEQTGTKSRPPPDCPASSRQPDPSPEIRNDISPPITDGEPPLGPHDPLQQPPLPSSDKT